MFVGGADGMGGVTRAFRNKLLGIASDGSTASCCLADLVRIAIKRFDLAVCANEFFGLVFAAVVEILCARCRTGTVQAHLTFGTSLRFFDAVFADFEDHVIDT